MEAQQACYRTIKSLRTGKMWTAELVKKLWDIAWDLWEHRNGVLHESENVVSNAALRHLDMKVMDTFNRIRSLLLPAHDRHLISLSLSRLLKKDRIYKEVWLNNALVSISGYNHTQWSKRHSNEVMLKGMQRCMRSYLRVRRPHSNS